MGPGQHVKHKVSQAAIYSVSGFLDTHPLFPYIRLFNDKHYHKSQKAQRPQRNGCLFF